MRDELVHLAESHGAYGDVSSWCDKDFPRKYSEDLNEVACRECLESAVKFGLIAQARLVELSKNQGDSTT